LEEVKKVTQVHGVDVENEV